MKKMRRLLTLGPGPSWWEPWQRPRSGLETAYRQLLSEYGYCTRLVTLIPARVKGSKLGNSYFQLCSHCPTNVHYSKAVLRPSRCLQEPLDSFFSPDPKIHPLQMCQDGAGCMAALSPQIMFVLTVDGILPSRCGQWEEGQARWRAQGAQKEHPLPLQAVPEPAGHQDTSVSFLERERGLVGIPGLPRSCVVASVGVFILSCTFVLRGFPNPFSSLQ